MDLKCHICSTNLARRDTATISARMGEPVQSLCRDCYRMTLRATMVEQKLEPSAMERHLADENVVDDLKSLLTELS